MLLRRERFWFNAETTAHEVFDLAGYALIVTGATFRCLASGEVRGHKGRNLVTTGPYALCRHPLYFGGLLCVTGVALVAQNSAFLLLTFSLWTCGYTAKILIEERKLKKAFGDEWNRYRAEVDAVFRSVRALRTKGVQALMGQTIRVSDAFAELPGAVTLMVGAAVVELVEHQLPR